MTASTRSVPVTPSRSAPGEVHAHHVGREEVPSAGRASPPRPRCRPRPRRRRRARSPWSCASRCRRACPGRRARPSRGRRGTRNSRFTWWQMPMPGRHDAQPLERLRAPLQELVARDGCASNSRSMLTRRASGEPNASTCTEWSTTRSTGHERLDGERVLAEPRHRRAHGGEVDEERHAGEVLQEHARDDEGDLPRALGRAGCQPASARTSSSWTRRPSTLRASDSSTIRSETGSREIGPEAPSPRGRAARRAGPSGRGRSRRCARAERIRRGVHATNLLTVARRIGKR